MTLSIKLALQNAASSGSPVQGVVELFERCQPDVNDSFGVGYLIFRDPRLEDGIVKTSSQLCDIMNRKQGSWILCPQNNGFRFSH